MLELPLPQAEAVAEALAQRGVAEAHMLTEELPETLPALGDALALKTPPNEPAS